MEFLRSSGSFSLSEIRVIDRGREGGREFTTCLVLTSIGPCSEDVEVSGPLSRPDFRTFERPERAIPGGRHFGLRSKGRGLVNYVGALLL